MPSELQNHFFSKARAINNFFREHTHLEQCFLLLFFHLQNDS
uniref:Uncharacterized protein n=1 Tax=Arundo donax TaxID=35708 RepID=A0A0A8ZXV6_ARUDO